MMDKVRKLGFGFITIVCLLLLMNLASAQEVEHSSIVTVLGIVEEEKDAQAEITRGEAASYIMRLRGHQADLSQNMVQDLNVFDDVMPGTQMAYDINAAYQLNYISGTSENTFEPDAPITYNQMLKMIVSVLGYDVKAQEWGGYPYGYAAVASTIGLTDGVVLNDEFVTKETVIHLFENALDIDLMERDYGEEQSYRVTEGNTLLTDVFHIEKRKGVVQASSEKQSLPGQKLLKDGYVQIDDVQYLAGESGASTCVGYMVDYYVYDYAEDDVKTIVFLEKKSHQVIEIEAENIDHVTEGSGYATIDYSLADQESKSKNAVINFDETTLIYNDIYSDIAIDTAAALSPSNGKVTLLDNDNDGKYEYVFVESYTIAVVKDYSPSSRTIYFTYPVDLTVPGEYSDTEFVLDEDEVDLISNSDLTVDDLAENHVLSIYKERQDNQGIEKNMKIIVADDKMDCIVEEANADEGIFVVEGTEYRLTQELKNQLKKDLKLPLEADCTLYLSAEGKIAYYTSYDSENRLYGFLTQAHALKGVDQTGYLRVFTQNGDFENFQLEDRVEVVRNGYQREKMDAADFIDSLYFDSELKVTYNSDPELRAIFGTPPAEGTLGNAPKLDDPNGIEGTSICYVEHLGLVTEPAWDIWGFGNYSGQTESAETGSVIFEMKPEYETFEADLPVNLQFLALAITNFNGQFPNAVNNHVAVYVSKVENPDIVNPDFTNESVWEKITLIKDSPPGFPLSYSYDITHLVSGFHQAYVAFEVTSTNGTWGCVSNVMINQGYHSGNLKFDRKNMTLVRFRMDRENKINLIEFADSVPESEADRLSKVEDGSFVLSHEKEMYYYYVYPSLVYETSSSVYPLFGISPDTIVFNIPGDPATSDLEDMKEEYFKIQALPLVGPGRNYLLESYNEDEAHAAKVIVNYATAGEQAYDIETPLVIVDKVVQTVDEDGEAYFKLTGWVDGNLREYRCRVGENVFVKKQIRNGEEVVVPLQKGDIITVPYIEADNTVKRICTIFTIDGNSENGFGYTYKYDVSDTNLTNPSLNTDYQIPAYGPADLMIVDGIVVAKSDQYMIIKSPVDDTMTYICYLGSPFIRVYTVSMETEKMQVDTTSTKDDFRIGDYVVIRQKSSTCRDCVRYVR